MYRKKSIEFIAGGESINRGRKQSVKTVLREKSSWLVIIWCIAHRLELSLNDTLKETDFKGVDEMLLQLHLLYRKAPKRLHQFKNPHDIYKETLELKGGDKPKKQMKVGLSHIN